MTMITNPNHCGAVFCSACDDSPPRFSECRAAKLREDLRHAFVRIERLREDLHAADKRADEAAKRADEAEEAMGSLVQWTSGKPPLEKNAWWGFGFVQSAIRELRERADRAADAERSLGHLLSLDPGTFWASLTPAQALSFLGAAPKVAGPWTHETTGGAFTYRRATAIGHTGDAAYTHRLGNGGWSYGTPGHRAVVTVPYPEDGTPEAERGADEALRTAGWLLVDEEPASSE